MRNNRENPLMDHAQIAGELRALAEGDEYAAFNKKIANTEKTVLGVRMPAMRKFSKALAKGMGAEEVRGVLAEADKEIYEQTLLAGLLINAAKLTDEERIGLARAYLVYADSWALIDLFAEKMKRFDRGLWWAFLTECLRAPEEYTVRFGVVELMANFLDGEEDVRAVFKALRGVRHDGYYVKMGLAWLYATAAIDCYELTMAEMRDEGIDAWTRRKALTKMIESYRITDAQKEEIRALRAALR
ncbi:MAG: DNA alkylation repair protein [Clostridiales bacterium]|nr:DNA alkylation repair protein [Clostridiales bacterium]